jgi:hypothetical protein
MTKLHSLQKQNRPQSVYFSRPAGDSSDDQALLAYEPHRLHSSQEVCEKSDPAFITPKRITAFFVPVSQIFARDHLEEAAQPLPSSQAQQYHS